MATHLFSKWLTLSTKDQRVSVWSERAGARAAGLKAVRRLVAEHFVGEATILQAGGYSKGPIRNNLITE
jgi:hypothetical protein